MQSGGEGPLKEKKNKNKYWFTKFGVVFMV